MRWSSSLLDCWFIFLARGGDGNGHSVRQIPAALSQKIYEMIRELVRLSLNGADGCTCDGALRQNQLAQSLGVVGVGSAGRTAFSRSLDRLLHFLHWLLDAKRQHRMVNDVVD